MGKFTVDFWPGFTDGRHHGPTNGKNLSGEKQCLGGWKVLAKVPWAPNRYTDDFREILEIRFWSARRSVGSVVYCTVWLTAPRATASGFGSARGYGYDRKAASFEIAMKSAGFTILRDGKDVGIGGSEDIRGILETLVRRLTVAPNSVCIVDF